MFTGRFYQDIKIILLKLKHPLAKYRFSLAIA